MKRKTLLAIALFLAPLSAALYLFLFQKSENGILLGQNKNLPTFTLYTALSATSPQLPFWLAVKSGELSKLANFEVKTWKSGEQLKTLALKGKGDFWVGHSDAFARVRKSGGPVKMALISTWKKFYLLGPARPGIFAWKDLNNQSVIVSPPTSPAGALLKYITKRNNLQLNLTFRELDHIFHVLQQDNQSYVLVPEPFASLIETKSAHLKILKNIESEFSDSAIQLGLPVAGIAINENTYKQQKDVIDKIINLMLSASLSVDKSENTLIQAIPEHYIAAIPMEINKLSLARETFVARRASDVRAEIKNYLTLLDETGNYYDSIDDFTADFLMAHETK
ncbi:MAG: hypothetical protein IT292_09805 [Deltaproteobacteria bacterium]|nr:hypothetical protein [Deltaproteobacteria bacterium]